MRTIKLLRYTVMHIAMYGVLSVILTGCGQSGVLSLPSDSANASVPEDPTDEENGEE